MVGWVGVGAVAHVPPNQPKMMMMIIEWILLLNSYAIVEKVLFLLLLCLRVALRINRSSGPSFHFIIPKKDMGLPFPCNDINFLLIRHYKDNQLLI